jgi:uncharacterized protein YbcI
MKGSDERLSGGALNAALANELGKLIADFTGRGATKSRAFVQQDVVICVLEEGATRAEQNLVAAGKAELVRIQRDALQRAMGPQLIAAVERLTGRRVHTFLSGSDESGSSAVEAFLLEPLSPALPDPRVDGRDRRVDGWDRRADGRDRRADGRDRRVDGRDRLAD